MVRKPEHKKIAEPNAYCERIRLIFFLVGSKEFYKNVKILYGNFSSVLKPRSNDTYTHSHRQ